MADLGLVVFSDDWGRHPSAPQHLFARVAAEHPVFWVETAGLRDPRPRPRDLARSAEKLRSWTGRPTAPWWAPLPPGMTRVVAPMVPGARGPLLGPARRAIRQALAKADLQDLRCVVTVPTAVDLALPLGPTLAWCVDDFALWPGLAHRRIRAAEARLLAGCIGLLASSEPLLSARRASVPQAELLEHGVDFERFAHPGPPPASLRALPRPLAIFAGKLDERLDHAALDALAAARPQLHIALVGEEAVPLGPLAQRPNVHRIPRVPYGELPALLAAADVLLLPYKDNAQTRTISPLKLREYLASGVPIAASRLPEVARIAGSLVAVGEGASGLLAAVDSVLADPGPPGPRQDAVRAHSWQARADQFLDFVRRLG